MTIRSIVEDLLQPDAETIQKNIDFLNSLKLDGEDKAKINAITKAMEMQKAQAVKPTNTMIPKNAQAAPPKDNAQVDTKQVTAQ